MKDIREKSHDVYTTMTEIVTAAMNKATDEGHGVSDILYVGINAVAGALAPVAALVGFTPRTGAGRVTEEETAATMNNTSLLVAALLTAKVTNFHPDGHTSIDYGPNQIFKAIDAAQRVLGTDPRPNLSRPMVAAADAHRPPERLGNSWHVDNSPTSTEDERPRYLN